MSWLTFSRRYLLATAGAGTAWLLARAGESGLPAGEEPLGALCSDLGCPPSIGQACLEALPADEISKQSLARSILGDLGCQRGGCPPARVLACLARERSRNDFRDGRIVRVDGWMLSRTETRLYALTALSQAAGTKAG